MYADKGEIWIVTVTLPVSDARPWTQHHIPEDLDGKQQGEHEGTSWWRKTYRVTFPVPSRPSRRSCRGERGGGARRVWSNSRVLICHEECDAAPGYSRLPSERCGSRRGNRTWPSAVAVTLTVAVDTRKPSTAQWLIYVPPVYHSTILRSAHTVCLCVLCGSENKQQLFPYTALTDRFFQWRLIGWVYQHYIHNCWVCRGQYVMWRNVTVHSHWYRPTFNGYATEQVDSNGNTNGNTYSNTW